MVIVCLLNLFMKLSHLSHLNCPKTCVSFWSRSSIHWFQPERPSALSRLCSSRNTPKLLKLQPEIRKIWKFTKSQKSKPHHFIKFQEGSHHVITRGTKLSNSPWTLRNRHPLDISVIARNIDIMNISTISNLKSLKSHSPLTPPKISQKQNDQIFSGHCRRGIQLLHLDRHRRGKAWGLKLFETSTCFEDDE